MTETTLEDQVGEMDGHGLDLTLFWEENEPVETPQGYWPHYQAAIVPTSNGHFEDYWEA